MEAFPEHRHRSYAKVNLDRENLQDRVLGILWDPNDDATFETWNQPLLGEDVSKTRILVLVILSGNPNDILGCFQPVFKKPCSKYVILFMLKIM